MFYLKASRPHVVTPNHMGSDVRTGSRGAHPRDAAAARPGYERTSHWWRLEYRRCLRTAVGREGARVVVADLQADRGTELADSIGGTFVSVDVTATEQIETAVDTAAALGPLRSARDATA